MTSNSMNMSGDRKLRNPVEFTVLGVLALGSAHGYDIFQDLADRLGDICRLGKSQVYALLSRLERDGLVSHEKVEQETLPAKKVFHLTREGREELESWFSSPVHSVRDLRIEFLIKLYFAGLNSPEKERQLVADQLAVCREKADRLKEVMRVSESQIERRGLEYRLAMVMTSITWLKGLAEID
jgi:DNA-binding PadR family transcriptional regulator